MLLAVVDSGFCVVWCCSRPDKETNSPICCICCYCSAVHHKMHLCVTQAMNSTDVCIYTTTYFNEQRFRGGNRNRRRGSSSSQGKARQRIVICRVTGLTTTTTAMHSIEIKPSGRRQPTRRLLGSPRIRTHSQQRAERISFPTSRRRRSAHLLYLNSFPDLQIHRAIIAVYTPRLRRHLIHYMQCAQQIGGIIICVINTIRTNAIHCCTLCWWNTQSHAASQSVISK